jgi:alcohol dehydrogenase class IV
MDFSFASAAPRAIFEAGAQEKTGEELDRLGVSRVMVVATPTQAGLAAEQARLIDERAAIVYPGAQPHTPTNVTEAALTAVSSVQADAVLAIGGGTAIGLSKAIAFRTGLPQLILPTTFCGSAMTSILIETERGARLMRDDPKIRAAMVIFDPNLLLALPASVARPSAMNALANAIEAMCAGDNEAKAAVTDFALQALAAALPRLAADPANLEALASALYGSALAGACGSTGTSVHHKICDALVGAFDVNHADAHCLMLPYTAAFERGRSSEGMRRVARAFGGEDAPGLIYELMLRVANHTSLKAMGLTRAALEKAADLVAEDSSFKPARATREDVFHMLTGAFEGARPEDAAHG